MMLMLGAGAYWGTSASCATRGGVLYQNAYQCTTVVPYLKLTPPLRSSTFAVGKIVVPTTAFNQGNNFRYTDRFTHALGSNRTPRPMPAAAFAPPRPVFDPFEDIRPGHWYNAPRPAVRPAPGSQPPMTPEYPDVGNIERHPFRARWPQKEKEPKPDQVGEPRPKPNTNVKFPRPIKGKEVKLLLWWQALIAMVFGAFTEIGDVVEALYGALPDRYKAPGSASTTEMSWLVWNYFDKIDWGQAVWNLVVNTIEDMLIGQLQGGRRRLGEAMAELGFARALNPGYFAGSGSIYSSEEEYAFQQAVYEALRRVVSEQEFETWHRGSSVVGSYSTDPADYRNVVSYPNAPARRVPRVNVSERY